MPPEPSVTIIGRGLAGAVLVEVLRDRGSAVRVFDKPQAGNASRVAAGVVNPVVLRRTVLSWRADHLLPVAERFYRDMEERYGVKLWHPIPMARLFGNEREREAWQLKCSETGLAPFLSTDEVMPIGIGQVLAPHGYGVVKRCAWLDVPAFLAAQRDRLLAEGSLVEDAAPEPGADELTVHCTGSFSGVPGLVPVKGELLTVRIPGLDLRTMVHRRGFLLPLGDDHYRLGSTFVWENVWSGPTEKAKQELLQRLSQITPLPVEVIDHHAGVRPASRDRRPILGRLSPPSPQGHPPNGGDPAERGAVFNGLGSRGVLLAPWCAMHLADHLLLGAPLDPEVDLARFSG